MFIFKPNVIYKTSDNTLTKKNIEKINTYLEHTQGIYDKNLYLKQIKPIKVYGFVGNFYNFETIYSLIEKPKIIDSFWGKIENKIQIDYQNIFLKRNIFELKELPKIEESFWGKIENKIQIDYNYIFSDNCLIKLKSDKN